jgi:DNA (cytosine-5)-methyltransferase 3A
MNVLSLFDGMSCGQIALNRSGIKYNNYFASEVDKHAIKVTQANYPDTIQLGCVKSVKSDGLPKIDLLIGGSPCQGFSFAGKQLNFEDERSKLFFEYVRLLNECKPKYFLLENVKMKKEYQDIISSYLGVEPIFIDSSLVSAQSRKRLYWTNIPNVAKPDDKGICLSDILIDNNKSSCRMVGRRKNESGVRDDYNKNIPIKQYIEKRNDAKANCLTTVSKDSLVYINKPLTMIKQLGHGFNKGFEKESHKTTSLTSSSWENNNFVNLDNNYRKFTPIEFERLQTVPENYTNHVSASQRYKMLGNGWTVDVISHIFSFMDIKNDR